MLFRIETDLHISDLLKLTNRRKNYGNSNTGF